MRSRAVGRRLKTTVDVSAHRLAIDAELTGNGRDLQALPVKFQDHHELPKSNHRAAPSRQGEKHRWRFALADLPGHAPGGQLRRQNWGKFEAHNWGRFNARSHQAASCHHGWPCTPCRLLGQGTSRSPHLGHWKLTTSDFELAPWELVPSERVLAWVPQPGWGSSPNVDGLRAGLMSTNHVRPP